MINPIGTSSHLQKNKEKTKPLVELKAKVYARDSCFAGRDTIECVVGFRIDSRTIKRGALKLNRLSKCH